jgi:hypothetical protein
MDKLFIIDNYYMPVNLSNEALIFPKFNKKIDVRYAKFMLDIIKVKLMTGELEYDEAVIEATPYLKTLNDRAKEIGKKYNMRPKTITFTHYMR